MSLNTASRYIELSVMTNIKINDIDVNSILIDGVKAWQDYTTSYKNYVPLSIDVNNNIYNDIGYKDGYRIRSGGAEQQYAGGCCTGFIPCKVGDTLRIYPSFSGENVLNAINFSDGSFNNLGQVTDSGVCYGICDSSYKTSVVDGVSTLTLTNSHNSSIRYVRITHKLTTGADLIITINEELN